MNSTWLRIDSGCGDPAFNMALDDVLLNGIQDFGRPVLRFYGWTQPAASFGYFQRYVDVERSTQLRPLVRRPTGGGIVPHDTDWTYSVTIPPSHEWYQLKARESYLRMHEWIVRSFDKLSINTTLAETVRTPKSGECFAGYEVHDVLWNGRKIAGAAQRRTRKGLLIQGSVQPPPLKLNRQEWQEAMTSATEETWELCLPDPQLQKAAKTLAVEKYSNEGYTQRR